MLGLSVRICSYGAFNLISPAKAAERIESALKQRVTVDGESSLILAWALS